MCIRDRVFQLFDPLKALDGRYCVRQYKMAFLHNGADLGADAVRNGLRTGRQRKIVWSHFMDAVFVHFVVDVLSDLVGKDDCL